MIDLLLQPPKDGRPPRVLLSQYVVSSADLYSYSSLALLATSILKVERSPKSHNTQAALHMLSAFRRVTKYCSKRPASWGNTTLPLGTLFRKTGCLIPLSIKTSPLLAKALGPLLTLMKIWPTRLHKILSPPN